MIATPRYSFWPRSFANLKGALDTGIGILRVIPVDVADIRIDEVSIQVKPQ